MLVLAQWNDWGVETMDANIQALIDVGLKPSAVLGFNEPNHEEQARLTSAAMSHRLDHFPALG